jgi:uncharacterized protein
VRAAREHLVAEVGVRPSRLLHLAESLGAAVVTEPATEHPPAGPVLRSPFVDLASVAAGLHRLVEVPGADHDDPVLLDGDALVDAVLEPA